MDHICVDIVDSKRCRWRGCRCCFCQSRKRQLVVQDDRRFISAILASSWRRLEKNGGSGPPYHFCPGFGQSNPYCFQVRSVVRRRHCVRPSYAGGLQIVQTKIEVDCIPRQAVWMAAVLPNPIIDAIPSYARTRAFTCVYAEARMPATPRPQTRLLGGCGKGVKQVVRNSHHKYQQQARAACRRAGVQNISREYG